MNPFEPYPYDYTEAVKKEPEFHQLQPVQQYDVNHVNLDNLSSPQFNHILFEAVASTDRIVQKPSDSGAVISNVCHVIDVQTEALQGAAQEEQSPNDLVDSFNDINLESISKLSPIFKAAYKGNKNEMQFK